MNIVRTQRGCARGSEKFQNGHADSIVCTLMFQIEDMAQKNLTWLKKGINFWAKASAVRPKHCGH